MKNLIAILCLFALIPATAAEDVIGFQDLAWGVDSKTIEKKFANEVTKLPQPFDAMRFYVEYEIQGYKISGLDFLVLFQMDKESKKLGQVVLEYKDEPSQYPNHQGDVETLEGLISKKYGKPTVIKSSIYSRTWVFPTTSIDLTYAYIPKYINQISIRYYPTNSTDLQKL